MAKIQSVDKSVPRWMPGLGIDDTDIAFLLGDDIVIAWNDGRAGFFV
jgi:hypothetical protein